MTRHSHQDAVDDATFNRLLEAADELVEPYRTECRFVLIAAGRLGLRAGEITHLDETWVNWERSLIEIPTIEPCNCGYCETQAQKSAAHVGISRETSESRMWSPKTPHSVRSVPFDFDEEIENVVSGFFFHNDGWPRSRSSINRRVDRVAEQAGVTAKRIYPHALRATAASHHAYRGVPAVALQNMMGWAQLAVAQKYLRLSGSATSQALNEAHQ